MRRERIIDNTLFSYFTREVRAFPSLPDATPLETRSVIDQGASLHQTSVKVFASLRILGGLRNFENWLSGVLLKILNTRTYWSRYNGKCVAKKVARTCNYRIFKSAQNQFS